MVSLGLSIFMSSFKNEMENNIYAPYLAITQQVMQSIWNRALHDFQSEAMSRLIMMRSILNKPTAMVLAQGAIGRGY